MKLKRTNFLPINLHFFGESEGGDSGTESAAIESTTTENGGETGSSDNANNPEKEDNTSKLDKIIQDAVDRATKKQANENKKLAEKLSKLQKEKLSEDELKKLEIENKVAEIAEREKQVLENENRLHAIKAIKTAGLDDGSENALELIDFVMGETKEDIEARVKSFGQLVDKFVKAKVDKTFKENGRVPSKGASGEVKSNNIAVELGKLTSKANEKSQNIIKSYL